MPTTKSNTAANAASSLGSIDTGVCTAASDRLWTACSRVFHSSQKLLVDV